MVTTQVNKLHPHQPQGAQKSRKSMVSWKSGVLTMEGGSDYERIKKKHILKQKTAKRSLAENQGQSRGFCFICFPPSSVTQR